jgi:hypothetical protein
LFSLPSVGDNAAMQNETKRLHFALTMTSARKRALSRYVFIVAAIVIAKAIDDAVFGAVGQGPLGKSIAGLVTAVVVVYVLWMMFWWRPKCPKCGRARARFVRQNHQPERLVCATCGFDEPTGEGNP